RITTGTFRLLHPDLGFKIVEKLSGVLGEANRTPEATAEWATAQERYARGVLEQRRELKLIVLAHTHRQRLVEAQPGRFYLNAGQWMGDRHYAVVSPQDIKLLKWP